MKICPYCNKKIPDQETKCPGCGKEYWLPGKTEGKSQEGKEVEEALKTGCLQILLMPLIVAFLSALLLIFAGVIINLFVNFESNQIKILWIIISLSAGLAIYFFLSKMKKKKVKSGIESD